MFHFSWDAGCSAQDKSGSCSLGWILTRLDQTWGWKTAVCLPRDYIDAPCLDFARWSKICPCEEHVGPSNRPDSRWLLKLLTGLSTLAVEHPCINLFHAVLPAARTVNCGLFTSFLKCLFLLLRVPPLPLFYHQHSWNNGQNTLTHIPTCVVGSYNLNYPIDIIKLISIHENQQT